MLNLRALSNYSDLPKSNTTNRAITAITRLLTAITVEIPLLLYKINLLYNFVAFCQLIICLTNIKAHLVLSLFQSKHNLN